MDRTLYQDLHVQNARKNSTTIGFQEPVLFLYTVEANGVCVALIAIKYQPLTLYLLKSPKNNFNS
jgi:hypothetical protein